jgi:hypothetical protein
MQPTGSVFPDHGPDPDHFQNKGLFWSDFPSKSQEKSIFTCFNIHCVSAKNSKIECKTSEKVAKMLCKAKNNVVPKFQPKNGLFFPLKWFVFNLGKKIGLFFHFSGLF